jgi:hypothetical protein
MVPSLFLLLQKNIGKKAWVVNAGRRVGDAP